MKRLVEIFRSPRKQEMYLYVDKHSGCAEVPDVLLTQFGEPEWVMTLLLTPQRKLARADADDPGGARRRGGRFVSCRMDLASLRPDQSDHRPNQDAGKQVAEDRAQAKPFGDRHCDHGGTQIDECVEQQSAHGSVLL